MYNFNSLHAKITAFGQQGDPKMGLSALQNRTETTQGNARKSS